MLESRYILNIEILRFAIRWNIGYEGKRGIKNNSKVFGLRSWKTEITLNGQRQQVARPQCRRLVRSPVLHMRFKELTCSEAGRQSVKNVQSSGTERKTNHFNQPTIRGSWDQGKLLDKWVLQEEHELTRKRGEREYSRKRKHLRKTRDQKICH